MSQYCPHIKTCPFYNNWVEHTKDRREDVIVSEGVPGRRYFDCITLIALDDPETGIPISDELKKRISTSNPKPSCSHITLLNHLINSQ